MKFGYLNCVKYLFKYVKDICFARVNYYFLNKNYNFP